MPLRYRCLILDHDDTAVDSSATIHHPSHLAAMRRLRPGCADLSLDDWFLKNFDPGIAAFLGAEIGLSADEQRQEQEIWRHHTRTITPNFYPGFLEALDAYRGAGGIVTVVTHSEEETVRRHYGDRQPDLVYGWTTDAARRKPNPWPVEQILARYRLAPGDALVVDDLKPGVVMARAAGVPCAAAGWAHRLPAIESYMRANTVAYLESIESFRRLVLTRASCSRSHGQPTGVP
ncbi:MAG: HAD family hydrolase [Deltaproteobacteria bacterium]|nr:HAD family hydrolase [Deltaproteobacteria bacterium]